MQRRESKERERDRKEWFKKQIDKENLHRKEKRENETVEDADRREKNSWIYSRDFKNTNPKSESPDMVNIFILCSVGAIVVLFFLALTG